MPPEWSGSPRRHRATPPEWSGRLLERQETREAQDSGGESGVGVGASPVGASVVGLSVSSSC